MTEISSPSFTRSAAAAAPERNRRAALVTFRGFEMHARRESTALADIGYDVDVICLERSGDEDNHDPRLNITRLTIPKQRGSLVSYAMSYGAWFVMCAAILTARHLRRRYEVIQITSLPDHQVFCAAIPKLLGAKLVLFLKEPTSELFHTLYANNNLTRVLRWLEMRSIAFANLSFAVTDQHRENYTRRGADPDRLRVVVNSTPAALLASRSGLDDNEPVQLDGVTMICPGTIEPRWGHECILRALALAREEVPDLRLVVTGEGTGVEQLKQVIDELDLHESVSLEGWVSLARLAQVFDAADIGLTAQQPSAYSHLVHTGKMYEYMMLGIPCIASRNNATAAYFNDDAVTFFEPDDHVDLARAMVKLARDPELRRIQAERASIAFRPFRWEAQQAAYTAAIAAITCD